MKQIILPLMALSNIGLSIAQKPNIVFILADDQRSSGTIHALGGNEVITPNLDELVHQGTTFMNAYIMGGSQAAVSAPSRNMLLTGRNLFSLGNKDGYEIGKNHITLGEALANVGYKTYGIGKWHNSISAFNRTFQNGDEIFFGGMSDDPYNVGLNHYDVTGKYNSIILNNAKEVNGDHIYKGKHNTEIFGDEAAKFINNYNEKNPFFLYIAFKSPHDPRITPQKYVDMYDTAQIKVPTNFLPRHPFDNGELDVRDEKLAAIPRKKQEIKCHIRDYYAMLTHLDEQVGKVIKSLKMKGIYENTIIVFAGDNGLALGQHGLMGKQNVYEHSVKVPLIFAGKNIRKGKKNSDFTYLFDIYPSLFQLIGETVPESVQGVSLFGKNAVKRIDMIYAYRDFQRAYRLGVWKLIEYNVGEIKTTQLFNLKSDPHEMNNLAENIKYAELIDKLHKGLLKKQIEFTKSNPVSK